jgi:hypothetical protein
MKIKFHVVRFLVLFIVLLHFLSLKNWSGAPAKICIRYIKWKIDAAVKAECDLQKRQQLQQYIENKKGAL